MFPKRKKIFEGCLLGLLLPFISYSQNCSISDASGCYCEDSISTNCDLLPDITISGDAILDSAAFYDEYPQWGVGDNNGKLRFTGATPNIGLGPIEIRATGKYVCGTDTLNYNPGLCPDSTYPKRIINQRIYHKNNNSMTFYDRPAGTMTYHPQHNHLHIDDWAIFSLRIKDDSEPDPLSWPIVGNSEKISFGLLDIGSCTGYAGYCRDTANTIIYNTDLLNFGFSGTMGANDTIQMMTVGYIDIYPKDMYGQWVEIPFGTCNGDYWLVAEVDPHNYFKETNENNNWTAVPITLTQQDLEGAQIIDEDRPPVLCEDESITLSVRSGFQYQWSTGAVTSSITVTDSGNYTVTIITDCDTMTTGTYSVRKLQSPPITVSKPDLICPYETATVSVSSNEEDSLKWFDAPINGNFLHMGATFTTPELISTTNFYVETQAKIDSFYRLAPADTNGGGFFSTTFNEYLYFDVYYPFNLKSVTVYALQAFPGIFRLLNENDSIIYTHTTALVPGENTVSLDFYITEGKNYKLLSVLPNLIFNMDSNVFYPYSVRGIVNIMGSSLGADKFPAFFNWLIEPDYKECTVSTPITIEVSTDLSCATNNVKVYPIPSNALNIEFKIGVKRDVSITLVDLLGQIVYRENLQDYTGEYNKTFRQSELNVGFYFVLIEIGSELQTYKIIIQ